MSNKNININLAEAVKNNEKLEYIISLVKQGADINYVYDQYLDVPKTIINIAAEVGNLELTKWLIDNDAKPFTKEFFGNSHELFIEHKKVFGDSAFRGIRLIDSACNSGNIELVDYLLNKLVQSTEVDLSEATCSGNLDLVKWLVEEKQVTIDNYSLAEAIPNHAIVNYLFSKDAKLNEDNPGIEISFAIRARDLDLVKLFYEKGSAINSYVLATIKKSNNDKLIKWFEEKNINILSKILKEDNNYIKIDLNTKIDVEYYNNSMVKELNLSIPLTENDQQKYHIHYLAQDASIFRSSYTKTIFEKDLLDDRKFFNELEIKVANDDIVPVLIDRSNLEDLVFNTMFSLGYVGDDGFPLREPLEALVNNALEANKFLKKNAGDQFTFAEISKLDKPILWPIWNDNCLNLSIKCISYELYIPKNEKNFSYGPSVIIGSINAEGINLVNEGTIKSQNDYYYKASEEVIISGNFGKLLSGGNMFLTSPKLSIEDGSIISSDKNMYLFNIENLICSNSKIKVKENLYLPKNENVHFGNCDMEANSIIYVDNRDIICNSENYYINYLEEYCATLGNAVTHNEL